MGAVERRHSPVYRQLEAYEESWKQDHKEAMACRDWEDAIAVGINIFHMLQEREQVWRDQVFRGALPYSEEDNLDHQARFASWLDTTRQVVAEILAGLEKRFGTVGGAAELRACADRAETILRKWEAPRLSAAVGLREMTLSPESAAELDRVLQEARQLPAEQPRPVMQEMAATNFKQRRKR
jgi:predicted anti-sigma-YlaC factor YlaD